MRRFHVPGAEPGGPQSGLGMTKRERRRLTTMLLGLGLVLAALLGGYWKSRQESRDPNLPDELDGVAETIHVPEVDAPTLERLVADDEPRTRVTLEPEALEALLVDVRKLTPESMAALGPHRLDGAALERLETDPAPHRGDAYLARGEVLQLDTRRASSGEQHHVGLIELEDGGRVWFLTLEIGELGGFVRVDGLFLKNYRAESDLEGDWVDAPLLVAPRAVRSYPDLGVTEEPDAALLSQLQDDVLVFDDGSPPRVAGLPYDAMWNLLDYVAHLEPDAIDWEAAPMLDEAALGALLDNGGPHRAQPFVLPISRLQGVRVKRAGENPARLEAVTEGWIGNATWQNVVHFKSPRVLPELQQRDYIHARGFFLKNFAYESAGRGLRIAPLFILDEIVPFIPKPDPGVKHLAWIVAIGSGLMALWLYLRVRRDRHAARAREEQRVERKRKRRIAATEETSPTPSS